MKLKLTLPLLVIVLGVAATVQIVRSGPEVETIEPPARIPLVRIVEVESRVLQLEVRSHGTVLPRTEADLAAEVAGRVIWASPGFESGGFFEAGDLLLRLDGSDYEVFRASAQAQLAQAEVRLVREEAEARLAVEEWREGEGGGGGWSAARASTKDLGGGTWQPSCGSPPPGVHDAPSGVPGMEGVLRSDAIHLHGGRFAGIGQWFYRFYGGATVRKAPNQRTADALVARPASATGAPIATGR